MEPNSSGIKTWQWVVTVVVIIVIIVICVLVFGGKGSQAPATGTNTVNTTDQTAALNKIDMNDQFPGNVVYINTVTVANPSWVVIQSDNSGQPGAVIGSAEYKAGMNPGGKLTLSQAMVDGGTYYAVIYTNDGSGKFSAATDKPLTDSSGNIVMKVFHATTSAGAGLKG